MSLYHEINEYLMDRVDKCEEKKLYIHVVQETIKTYLDCFEDEIFYVDWDGPLAVNIFTIWINDIYNLSITIDMQFPPTIRIYVAMKEKRNLENKYIFSNSYSDKIVVWDLDVYKKYYNAKVYGINSKAGA